MCNTKIVKLDCTEKTKEVKIMLPKGHFESDWFRCRSCGYVVRIKTLSDTIQCSECGGTMDRS